jgi:predicted PurR-regulated permease PerM
MPRSAPPDRPLDLARVTFQLLVLGALVVGTFWILRPFLLPLTWAIMIVVATWPLLTWTRARSGGRRGLAAAAMTLALLLVFAMPTTFAVTALMATLGHLPEVAPRLAGLTIPPPPDWVETVPVVGSKLAERWHRVAAAGLEDLSASLSPYVRGVTIALLGRLGSVGRLLVDVVLTVLFAGILYSTGETAARGAERFAGRLAGRPGENAVHVAGQAIRAVAMGVIVTAIVMTALVGIGLAISGVPFVGILTAVMFVLSIAQLGPAPVLIPAVIWVYAQHGAAWGTGLLAWAIVCIVVDRVVQPVLIKRGADLPLLMVFAGVVGGLLAFGVIGLFIGPVVLAVARALLEAWVAQERGAEGPPSRRLGEGG